MDTIAPSGLDEVSLDASRLSRRQMLTAAVGMAAGCLIRAALPAAHAAGESRPEVQPRKAGTMKVGLYSITFLGLWYRGSPLTLEDVVRRAKQYGYDGMEIDGKRRTAIPWTGPRAAATSYGGLPTAKGLKSTPWLPTTISAARFPSTGRARWPMFGNCYAWPRT